jgi:hypothetical protein
VDVTHVIDMAQVRGRLRWWQGPAVELRGGTTSGTRFCWSYTAAGVHRRREAHSLDEALAAIEQARGRGPRPELTISAGPPRRPRLQ